MTQNSENLPYEPELSEEVVSRSKGLRTGFTTGSVTAAAAKAAVLNLLTKTLPKSVTIVLPNGSDAEFEVLAPNPEVIESARYLLKTQVFGSATVIKDAGDDPDCTHGAQITVIAEETELLKGKPPTIEIIAGPGIGTVTLEGLGIEVGKPSITKVPLRMINQSVRDVNKDKSFLLTVTVPGGIEMAAKTTNDRLGIVGGISILGTTGIVKPFSTAAYRASVVQQINVAHVQGLDQVVLVTGYRTENFAFQKWPNINKLSVVEVGDFTGVALKKATSLGFKYITFVGMGGKIAKLADGIMMTHYKRSNVNTELLFKLAQTTGAPDTIRSAARKTNTARHFVETCVNLNFVDPLNLLCQLAAENCRKYSGSKAEVKVYMTDFEGKTELANSNINKDAD